MSLNAEQQTREIRHFWHPVKQKLPKTNNITNEKKMNGIDYFI